MTPPTPENDIDWDSVHSVDIRTNKKYHKILAEFAKVVSISGMESYEPHITPVSSTDFSLEYLFRNQRHGIDQWYEISFCFADEEYTRISVLSVKRN